MKRQACIVVLGVAVLYSTLLVAGDERKGRRAEQAKAAKVEHVAREVSWAGDGIVIIDVDGVVEVMSGDTVRKNTMGFDMHWSQAERDAALSKAQEPGGVLEQAYAGAVVVTYDMRTRAWDVSVDGEAVAHFIRPPAVTPDAEEQFLRLMDTFFNDYLPSVDVLDIAHETLGGVAGCTPGNSCCTVTTGDHVLSADCPSGQYAYCSCNANGCIARCRAIMM
jgi:hypothetical protein